MNIIDVKRKLHAPFHPNDIEWMVGSINGNKTKGMALPFVTNRAIQARLDDVFGPFGWQNVFNECGKSQLCGISVYDYEKKEWITKWDKVDDSNIDGLSESMQRAAYQWGIGRYLHKLPQIWMPLKQVGERYILAARPTLPEWAMPIGMITYNQEKELREVVSEYGVPMETINKIIYNRYHRSDIKDLTEEQANDLILYIKMEYGEVESNGSKSD